MSIWSFMTVDQEIGPSAVVSIRVGGRRARPCRPDPHRAILAGRQVPGAVRG